MKFTCDHEVKTYHNCPNCGGPVEMDNTLSTSEDEEVTEQLHKDENGEVEEITLSTQISFWP